MDKAAVEIGHTTGMYVDVRKLRRVDFMSAIYKLYPSANMQSVQRRFSDILGR